MLLIHKNDFQISAGSRLVKAEDSAAVSTAEEIITAAQAEADRILQEANTAFEEAKQAGYTKGLEDGKKEIIQKKLEMVSQSVEFMQSVEHKLADVVIHALKKIISEIPDRSIILQVVQKAMDAIVRSQQEITLKVAPDMVEMMKEHVEELKIKYPQLKFIHVVEAKHLKGNASIIETEAGVVEASVQSQIEAFEKSFERAIGKDM